LSLKKIAKKLRKKLGLDWWGVLWWLIAKVSGDLGGRVNDWVREAEERYPQPGSGEGKFAWVLSQAVDEFADEIRKRGQWYVHWLIESAVARLNSRKGG